MLSCRFLLIASVVNSLVTRLHVTLQQTLDTSLPFHKWKLADSVECVTAAGCQDLNWGNWCFWYGCSDGGPLFSACFRMSMLCIAFARASSRGLCSERICAHAPLPCMNKPQQSANIRCYHHSPRRFNWIQITSDSTSPSSVGFALWRDKIFIFLLGWSPNGELCSYHVVWSPARSTCMSRVTRW